MNTTGCWEASKHAGIPFGTGKGERPHCLELDLGQTFALFRCEGGQLRLLGLVFLGLGDLQLSLDRGLTQEHLTYGQARHDAEIPHLVGWKSPSWAGGGPPPRPPPTPPPPPPPPPAGGVGSCACCGHLAGPPNVSQANHGIRSQPATSCVAWLFFLAFFLRLNSGESEAALRRAPS